MKNSVSKRQWEKLAAESNYNAHALAKLCDLSVRQLERKVLRKFGTSPQAWLDELRIQGTDLNGSPYQGASISASFEVTPDGGTREADIEPMYRRPTLELAPDGRFTVAFISDYDFDTQAGDLVIQIGVVDTLLNPSANYSGALLGPAYPSVFNTPSSGGFGGDPGLLENQSQVADLLADLAPVSEVTPGPLPPFANDTRNFFFMGHNRADQSALCNEAESVVISRNAICAALGNVTDEETRVTEVNHSYRFVFLHACGTAKTPDWASAFRIKEEIWGADVWENPDGVQAFVGWSGDCKLPEDGLEWYAYQNTFNFFFAGWMLIISRCRIL